ncbi:MAG: HAD-IA family hydrolase [Firmicutes bacterium]|nr:HAD-IA family hydrolase [Bacillota bacterium]
MKKKKVQTLILDFDGTLIDSHLDIAKAANYTLRKMGRPELAIEQIKGYIGGGLGPLLKKSLGEENLNLFAEAMPIYRQYYYEHCTDYTTLYPGAREILEHFRDRDIAMATNKMFALTMKILEHFDIARYFKIVLGPDSVQRRKPHPEAIEKILTELGNPKETALMVGDTRFDIEAGKNAGIMTCGVTYGFGSRQEVEECGADIIIDGLQELTLYYE